MTKSAAGSRAFSDVMFFSDLPSCCERQVLRLPRPNFAAHRVVGGSKSSEAWLLGLDSWSLNVLVVWDDDRDDLRSEVGAHLDRRDLSWEATKEALARHGVDLDEDGYAFVGSQETVVASLVSEWSLPAGREVLSTPYEVWSAADALSGDLDELVAPLVDLRGDDGAWSKPLVERCPEVDVSDTIILLRSVRITPVMRGHLLGAWAAAQSIAMFDRGLSLVATLAAPLTRKDAVPGLQDDGRDLTDAESALWKVEQGRLARHWKKHLGLVSLPRKPEVLVWHSGYQNLDLSRTLEVWSDFS